MKNIVLALAVASLCACGGYDSSSTGPQNQPSGNTPPPAGGISVTNDVYNPSTKTVVVGATVTWSWNSCTGDPYYGETCGQHSVTFDDGITSPTQDKGSFTRTFTAAGTYNYHCVVHAGMTGTITVQ